MKHGDKFSAIINGVEVEGRISISTSMLHIRQNLRVYLCQDIQEGDLCQNTLGYKYSWCVGSDHTIRINNNYILMTGRISAGVYNFRILSDRKSRIECLVL